MENASKALIIAASVLIAILIVALGVTIFNKAQSAADTSSLDATEISMFNNKFERYANNQLGSQVKSLISTLISNASLNAENPSQLPGVLLQGLSIQSSGVRYGTSAIYGDATAMNNLDNYVKQLSTLRNSIISTHTYNVKLGYGRTGLVDSISININGN